jgi:hypothetical protein
MKSTTLSLSVVLLAAGTLVLMGGADSGPQVADAFFWGWPSYSWAWPSYFYPSFYFPSYMVKKL